MSGRLAGSVGYGTYPDTYSSYGGGYGNYGTYPMGLNDYGS